MHPHPHNHHCTPDALSTLCTQSKQTGGVAPTKKGVSLSQPDWAALQAVIPAANKALDDSDDTFVAELPGNKRATVSVFRCAQGAHTHSCAGANSMPNHTLPCMSTTGQRPVVSAPKRDVRPQGWHLCVSHPCCCCCCLQWEAAGWCA